MRIIATAAVAAFCFFSAPAGAQNYQFSSVTASARQVYASCFTMSKRGGLTDPRASCACITGYMGASMSDRDFEVAGILLRVGEMTETGAAQAAIEAEITAFFERGFTEEDIQRVASTVEQISQRGDSICGQFEQQGSV
ncbi:MAG: hypothetical protein ACOZAA_12765 [Pseudomonadota bacterium]